MTMGHGSVFSGTWKQKLDTHSSMKSEVVGVYQVLQYIIWTQKFTEKQSV